jgi:hypothetical protein
VTPPFSTPHVLAQFAYKAYEDYETDKTDAEWDTVSFTGLLEVIDDGVW